MKKLLIVMIGAASATLRADFPAATYSLSCDGNVTAVSSFLGGSALPVLQQTYPPAKSYIAVRDSETDKAFVMSDAVQPSNTGNVLGSGAWSMLVVARGADSANGGVYWDAGGTAWESWGSYNPQGFSLIRTGNGNTALVLRSKSSPVTILSAPVDNDTTKFHAFLVTYNPEASGTEESPYFVFYVDGVKTAQSTTDYTVEAFVGYQFGGVYGGSANAHLFNGDQFVIDAIGVWQSQLTAAQAAEVCAHYPVWPNVTRHAATMYADAAFSGLAWSPAWADSSTAIANISATANATLTIDTALQAYGIEVASANDFGLVLGENGSFDGVASINLSAVIGKILLDGTTFPSAARMLFANTATVRVESATAVVPPATPEGLLGMLNKSGQTLEIAAPVTCPQVGGRAFLGFGNATGMQTVIFDEGTAIDADVLVLGSYNYANVSIAQNGGSVVLRGTGSGNEGAALVIAQKPLSISSYTIMGGACDVSAGEVYLGYPFDNGLDASLTVGGGSESAFLSAKRIAASDSRANARTVTVGANGTLVLGSGGIDLSSPGGRVTLAGGTVRTTSTTAISAQGGVVVTGDVTIDVAAGTILTLPAITGTGNITKTGDGTLCFSEASPDFSGAIHVTDGAIGVSGEGAAGSGQLTFEAGAQLKVFATADLLAAGGDLIVSQPNLASGSADPSIVVVAPGGLTELMDSVDYVCSAGSGTIVFTFPMRASGYGAWFDFTFTRDGLAGRQTESRNIRNDGYAGSSAYLLFDGTWRGTSGYDTANGRLLLKTTPCRDMTGSFAWPSRWTVAVVSHLPITENACLFAVGSTSSDHGSRNYLALARGASSTEVRLVKGTGYTAAQTLATMSIPQADANAMHLFILDYDGTTCEVFHASGVNYTVQQIGTCTLDAYVPGGGFQVGSIHGGIGGTGLLRIDELDDANSYRVKAVRIFNTVLNAPCRQSISDELVKMAGLIIIVR